MKICFLANASSVFTNIFIDHFIKNHNIYVISYHKPKNINPKARIIYFNKKNKIDFIKFIYFAKNEIKKIKPDILYAHYLSHYGFVGSLTGFHPYIISPLGSDIASEPEESIITRIMVKNAIKKADLIQTQDHLSEKRIIELGGKKTKIVTIPWGVNIEILEDNKKNKKKFDVINLNGYAFEQHSIDVFLKSIKYVKKKIPDVQFLLLASDEKSKKLSKKLEIDNNIHFTDYVSHNTAINYLFQSKIFVESFAPKVTHGGHTYGLSVQEAMACGIPTIVTNRPTVLLDGKYRWYYGLTFEKNNPKMLADQIITLLSNAPLYDNISKKNKEIAYKKFDLESNLNKIEKTMLNLLKNF